MASIEDRRIAVLATDGMEQVELTEPVKALSEAGARVQVIASKSGTIQGMNHDKSGRPDTRMAAADRQRVENRIRSHPAHDVSKPPAAGGTRTIAPLQAPAFEGQPNRAVA
jgi:hypothetical protein